VNAVGRAGILFDHAAGAPEGFLALDVCKQHEWSRSQYARAVRRILASDSINLITISQGFGKARLYHLVGTLEKAGPWVAERMRGLESQLETVLAVSNSLVVASDGRTIAGKKARLTQKHVTRLLEDFAEVDGRLL